MPGDSSRSLGHRGLLRAARSPAVAGAILVTLLCATPPLAAGGVAADSPNRQAVPTPIVTVVAPLEERVVPRSEVVEPESARADAETGPAETDGVNASDSDNLFTGVRGALIGAAIGIGIVALVVTAIAGARIMLRRSRP